MRAIFLTAMVAATATAALAAAPPKQGQTPAPAAAPAPQAAATPTPGPQAPQAPAAKPCANPNALGVSRTVEVDTTGGPGFGLEQYKAYDFLEPGEVVLTFDDGPQVRTTEAILAALANHCTKATFFSIGKMAVGMPEIIREVAKQGHTVGSHTWSHADLRKKKDEKEAVAEFEKGLSGVNRALGTPVAPFFRFPFLMDSPAMLTHLSNRNVAVFSMDVDSFDFKFRNAEQTVKMVMDKLEKKGKGIVLMHDIQPTTVKAMPLLLDALKAKGYRVVHMKPKAGAKTVAEFDALIEKDVKGLPAAASERPTSSVIKTVPNAP